MFSRSTVHNGVKLSNACLFVSFCRNATNCSEVPIATEHLFLPTRRSHVNHGVGKLFTIFLKFVPTNFLRFTLVLCCSNVSNTINALFFTLNVHDLKQNVCKLNNILLYKVINFITDKKGAHTFMIIDCV